MFNVDNYQAAHADFTESVRQLAVAGMPKEEVRKEMLKVDPAQIGAFLEFGSNRDSLSSFEFAIATKMTITLDKYPVSYVKVTAIIESVRQELEDGGVFVSV